MQEKKDEFEFTYSAKEQKEIEQIRKKYMPKEADKMALLRKLDNQATIRGKIISIIMGTIGFMIFGGGMSMIFVGPRKMLGFAIGITIIGFLIMGFAYPVYLKVMEREREKYAPQILALAEEILQ